MDSGLSEGGAIDVVDRRDAGSMDAEADREVADAGPPCSADEYVIYTWKVDGVPGGTGCFAPSASGEVVEDPSAGPYGIVSLGGGVTGRRPAFPDPIIGAAGGIWSGEWVLDLATGESGRVERFVWTEWHRIMAGAGLCVRAGAGDPVSTGGTWEIIQGGTWGDVIEIVIRDVTFDGLIGHDFVMESMHWRVRLPSSPIVHHGSSDGGPPPSDGGGAG